MATETVSAPALKEFASAHADSLYDAVALLDAAAQRIDDATPMMGEDPEAAEAEHNTLRLVQMAHKKVKAVADMLFDSEAAHG